MSTPTSETEPELDREDFAHLNGISSTSQELPPTATSTQEPPPEEFVTRRNTWEQPWPKALLVGSGILGFVAVLGSMLHGTTEAFNDAVVNQKTTASVSSTTDSRQASKAKETDTDGDKDAKVALTTQINELRNQKQHPDSTPAPSPLPTASVEPDEPIVQSNQRIRRLPPVAQAADVPDQPVYRPTPQQLVQPGRESPHERAEFAPIDPNQAWAQASNVGTWGGVALHQKGNASGSDIASSGIEQRISSAGQFVASVAPQNVDSVAGGPRAQRVPLSVTSQPKHPDSNGIGSNGIGSNGIGSNGVGSNGIGSNGIGFNGKPNILAGTRVLGMITAPLAWSGNDSNSAPIEQVASIQLRENLTDSDGQVVLPDKSVVIAKITRATNSGVVTMVAMSAQTPLGDKSFPPNSVLVLAQGGGVLRAKVELPGNIGDNFGTALYAGINKGAETINRPSSGSSSGSSGYGGGFQSFNFTSKNNVLAGVAEGLTGAMMQSSMARNQLKMQRLQSQEATYVIKEHTLVQICFNQSVAL